MVEERNMNRNPVVAVVGATGAVGVEFLKCFEHRNFPVKELRLLASARSAGKQMTFRGQKHTVAELKEEAFDGVDIAFFSAGSKISREFGPKAAARGAVVIDNSSAFRMDPEIPLVVPEINPGDIQQAISNGRRIIANPNCSTIIGITPLWPIHQKNPIKRLIITTYQAASGAGAAAMQELLDSTKAYLEDRPFNPTVMPHPYAFNL